GQGPAGGGDASLSFVTWVVDDSGGRGPDSTATP
ncbi:MAG: hypothetical protein QOF73_4312, partial [Thermomicrobiales bacterium]|nr:hypothetical protein [Thermomicrobiales bacterium]